MTDSSTGGYLAPSTAPLDDQALMRFMHDVIAGVTGLDNKLVVPSWQPDPKVRPGIDINWCGYAITNYATENGTAWQWTDSGELYFLRRHESFDLQCSFYGPSCISYAGMLRDGLQLSQNREALYLAGMTHTGAGSIMRMPELSNYRWFDRADITLNFNREIVREYPVLSFLSAPINLNKN